MTPTEGRTASTNFAVESKRMMEQFASYEAPTEIDSRDLGTPDEWVARDPALIRLTGKHPFNAEPPSDVMLDAGFITPQNLHFVRSHGKCPKFEWESHTFKVQGFCKETTFTMNELASLSTTTLPATIVCAGNRRSELNKIKHTTGFNFGTSAHGCSFWTGVRLADLLQLCDVDLHSAKHVEFVGGQQEGLPQDRTYGSSIPISLAMDKYADVLIAFEQNGRRLMPDHGFPVRAIIPGWVAGRSVKWLKEINVTAEPSANYYFFMDNRILPPHVDAELAKAEGWCYRPEYLYNEITINSAISYPRHGDIMVLNNGRYTLKGYGYSGGGRKVTRVELTFNDGDTWKLCEVDHPEERQSEAPANGHYWCWMFWEYTIDKYELLQCAMGTGSIRVRAWDSSNNTQPESLTWNLMGMGNSCQFCIKVQPIANREARSSFALEFLHPSVPGVSTAGWMIPTTPPKKSAVKDIKPLLTSPAKNAIPKVRTISKAEVTAHAHESSCWIVVEGRVYDVTRYLKDHPGGIASILTNGGEDLTEDFLAIHSEKARTMLAEYFIGDLAEEDIMTTKQVAPDSQAKTILKFGEQHQLLNKSHGSHGPEEFTALNPKEWIAFKLIDNVEISHDTRLLRFALPTPQHKLGLPVGHHMLVQAPDERKMVVRAYTPVSSDEDRGEFTLCVKVYFGGVNRKFPFGGKLSQYMNVMNSGDELKVKGPFGRLSYTGRGRFMLSDEKRRVKRLGFICGGTGITPAFQVMQAICKDENDTTEVMLLCANRTPSDILMRDELEKMAAARPEQIKVWYTVDIAPDGWKYSTGFIGEEMLRKRLPSARNDTFVGMCGPPPMIEIACIPNLKKIGFSEDQFMCF